MSVVKYGTKDKLQKLLNHPQKFRQMLVRVWTQEQALEELDKLDKRTGSHWRELNEYSGEPSTGFCRFTVGAIYGLLGGPKSGLKIMGCQVEAAYGGDQNWHYWLLNKATNKIIDPTRDQMPEDFPYDGSPQMIRWKKTESGVLTIRRLLRKELDKA
jgi:hypothetical protein